MVCRCGDLVTYLIFSIGLNSCCFWFIGSMADFLLRTDHPLDCTCRQCCVRYSWQCEAEYAYWAACLEDGCAPMDLDEGFPFINFSDEVVRPSAVNGFSDEIWSLIFNFISDFCPHHSFSSLSDISCLSRIPAHALSSEQVEHARLLQINLEVEREIDNNYEMLQDAADEFFDTWSIDSGGNWHDRRDDTRDMYHAMPSMTFNIPIHDGPDNRVRQIRIGIPSGWLANPILSDVVVEGQPLLDDGGSSVLATLMRNTVFPMPVPSPEATVNETPHSPSRHPARIPSFEAPASPMSVASTVAADYDPMLARQEL